MINANSIMDQLPKQIRCTLLSRKPDGHYEDVGTLDTDSISELDQYAQNNIKHFIDETLEAEHLNMVLSKGEFYYIYNVAEGRFSKVSHSEYNSIENGK